MKSFIIVALDKYTNETTLGVVTAETTGEAVKIAEKEYELNSLDEIVEVEELNLTEKGCNYLTCFRVSL